MGFFSRPPAPLSRDVTDENLLVISDVHLGEDILDEGPESLSEYIRALNWRLAEFVADHRKRRLDGRPWHLVINGDMFDFLKITDRRDSLEGLVRERELTPEERARDLVNTPENVLWKLDRVLAVHRPLFKELAAFLLAGNKVTLLEGNHDAEFYFAEVRARLREALVALAERQHAADKKAGLTRAAFDAEAVSARLAFHTWFLARPGRVHVEHGHQYDPYCSFEYRLAPFDRDEKSLLATPMSHRAVPYVADLLGDFSTHGIDHLGLGRFVAEFGKRGRRTLWTILRLYFGVGLLLVRRAGARRKKELLAWAAEHEAGLKALALEAPYGLDTLRRLDALRAQPVEFSFWKSVQVFYFDRVALGLGIVLGGVASAFLKGPAALMVLGATLAAGGGGMFLSSLGRKNDVHQSLRTAAARIADLTGARYVVFGHSHKPELTKLDEPGVGRFGAPAYYVNSGSWVTREILRGEAGTGMTYVEITPAGAALMRWQGATQPATVLASARGPSSTTPATPTTAMTPAS